MPRPSKISVERAVMLAELKLHIDSLRLHFEGISRTFDRIAEIEVHLDASASRKLPKSGKLKLEKIDE